MKKISLLILTVLFIFSFNIDLKADCFDDDLNEWATKISPKFVENDSEYFFAYFLTIDPYRDDVIIKVTDKDGKSAFGKKYEAMNSTNAKQRGTDWNGIICKKTLDFCKQVWYRLALKGA